MDQDHVLVVSANFAADPLVEPLEFWFRELGLAWRAELAPYDQVFQQLLDPTSLLRRNRTGMNVLLIRLDDWGRTGGEGSPLERDLDDLARAVGEAAGQSTLAHLVLICPPSRAVSAQPGRSASLAAAEERLMRALAGRSNVEVVSGNELMARYPVTEYDNPKGERLADVPYTEELFAGLATLIARVAYRRTTPPTKVIALDCDGTLWRGVCGEVGADGIAIEDGHRALQRFVVERGRRGTLLVLCSKNNETDVWQVFDERDDMLLQRADLVAVRLNWRPKSENMRELAEELGLGLDSFALLDDDPVACAEVRANCPGVLTLKLPSDPNDYGEFLEHVWAFDAAATTSEDAERTTRYREESNRRAAQSSAPSFGDFIASLAVNVRIEEPRPEQLGRLAQLTMRTNQFNVTGIRRNESELQALLEHGDLEARVVEVSDRFGDYGLVGLLLYRREAAALVVDTFLLSCRALGRGVEQRMLAELGQLARKTEAARVEIPYRPSQKNAPARQFLERTTGRSGEGATVFSLPCEVAAATTFRPDDDAAPQSPSSGESHAVASQDPPRGQEVLYRVATELRTPHAVLSAVRGARAGSRPLDAEHVAPRTALEHALGELWSTQLGVLGPGVADDFFASGGHSLQAALLVAQASHDFGIELSLLDFFEAPTIAGLAEAVERKQVETFESEQLATALGELEELSDEEVLALLAEEDGRAGQ